MPLFNNKNFQDLFDPTTSYGDYEEWDAASTLGRLTWTKTVAGTGTNAIISSTGRPGINRMTVISSTTPDSIVFNLSAGTITVGGGIFTFECNIMFPALSISTDEFRWEVGLSSAGAVATDGQNLVTIRYNRANDGNFFTLSARSGGGTKQVAISTLAVVANTWYTLRFIIDATAANVTLYGAASGSALPQIATLSSGVPNGNTVGPMEVLVKSAGTTQIFAQNDYIAWKQIFTTPR